ncbi:hypothetical protein [Phormidium sp. CCY1219]|uniref:hypothetical protein n=1 Tax=Phormidium sp. CCY1219 TaxID=2886104 RepID=UPI002D1EEB2D|nr:hypothetical protein [Phormidium sp. CCY1219]MEB3826239.1 hypothetical protein [Phormidium sp. CCY1219]
MSQTFEAIKIPIKEVDIQKTADLFNETLGEIQKGIVDALSWNDFSFIIRNNTEALLKRTGAVNDSGAWPFEDIEPKTVVAKFLKAKSFSFAAKYALPHREICIGCSYPLVGYKKVAMEWSADPKITWDNMSNGEDKSADENRAYIMQKDGNYIWVFEVNG